LQKQITTNWPILTLVMPTYNASKVVAKSIESYLHLKRLANIQVSLIVVDDASTDDTVAIIEGYIRAENSIKLIKSRINSGPGAARNRALNEIQSGYVGFIDTDDQILYDSYLNIFYEGVDYAADLITFDAEIVGAGITSSRYDFSRLSLNRPEMVRNCIRGLLDGSVIFSIYSIDLIKSKKICFAAGFYEDIYFSYSAIMQAKRLFISNNIGYRKFNSTGSITNTISEKHILGMLSACSSVRCKALEIIPSKYEKFEDDFSFGLYGYVKTLLDSIVKHNDTLSKLITLMDFLYHSYSKYPDFLLHRSRSETQVDMLVSEFLKVWREDGDKATFINSIKKQKTSLSLGAK